MKRILKLILFCTAFILIIKNHSVYAEIFDRKDVLILHSYHRGYEWTENVEEGIHSVLSNDEDDINIKIEYMDTKRINNQRYLEKLVDLYKYKYGNGKIDLIISSDNAAFDFLRNNKKEIFPNVPVVFCGVNNFNSSLLKEQENITGVIEEIDIKSNIELMLELHPEVEQIITVMDTTILGDEINKIFKRVISETTFHIPIANIRMGSLNETIKKINEFPENSVVLYMASRFKEEDGDIICLVEGLKDTRRRIKYPIYGVWDVVIGNGVIGGEFKSGFYQGQSAGEIAKNILEGKSVEDIPIKILRNKRYIFDYNELMDYGIKVSQLPPHSSIINEPTSVYSIAKRTLTKAGATVIFIFIVIIIILFINILKRRKIQEQLEYSKIELQKNLKFLRVLLDTIPNPIFHKDIKGRYIDVNTAYTEYIGLSKEEIINRTVYDINQGVFAHYHHFKDAHLIQSRGKQNYESKVRFPNGNMRDVLFSKATLISDENEVEGIVGVMLDITERKKIEEKINRLSKLKEAMLEVNQSIIGIDNINKLFDLILEKAIESIESANLGSVFILNDNRLLKIAAFKGYDPEQIKDFSIPLEDSFIWHKTNGNIGKTIVINNLENLGEDLIIDMVPNTEGDRPKSSIIAPIMIDGQLYGQLYVDSINENEFDNEDLELLKYMRNQIEIAIGKHKLYEETIYLSRYDKLTNVYNRRYFEEVFDQHFEKALRYNENFCMVVFDLNGLKIVNDTYGHLAGDLYIKTFANSLSDRMRSSDILARYGGDEFVAVFFETDSQSLVLKFEELVEDFKNNPISFEGNNIVCSFSYGIANFPYDAKVYNHLVKIADERMYKYKQKVKSKMKK